MRWVAAGAGGMIPGGWRDKHFLQARITSALFLRFCAFLQAWYAHIRLEDSNGLFVRGAVFTATPDKRRVLGTGLPAVRGVL